MQGIPVSFEPLLHHVPAWLLVLFRLTGIFILAPVFGSQAIPMRVKVFLAFTLSLCVYPVLLNAGSASAVGILPILNGGLTLWTLAACVALELAIGFLIGYCTSLVIIGMQVGGQLIDQQLGLALAGIINPELGEQNGIVSEILFLSSVTLFVALGGHRIMFDVLVGSFQSVPLGGFRVDGHMLELIVGLLGASFEMGVRVAAPLLCLIFLETMAMGFVARTVPQMNILSIGFAVRILMGVALLVAAMGTIVAVFESQLRFTLRQIAIYFGM